MIPLAALIGVMFVVSIKTFEWGSFRLFGKVPRSDIFVGLAVAGITLFENLATAVIVGVIFSALSFAWQHAKQIMAKTHIDANGWKVYTLEGTLFFASIANFNQLFTPFKDPENVVIDFAGAKVVDHSALEAIDSMALKYINTNKKLHLVHLSPDCKELLTNAKDLVELNVLEDPQYHIADNKLG